MIVAFIEDGATMALPIAARVVAVTGGARFIGQAIARQLAGAVPQRLRDFALRSMMPDQAAATHGWSARSGYESHALSESPDT